MADAGKKRKMSKADKERLKKEEQERKAQEEGLDKGWTPVPQDSNRSASSDRSNKAARIKALEEAKKQKKVEAALAIERAKLENEERKRRREDLTNLQQFLDDNKHQLLELNKERRKQAKWSRYMRCDGSPDPVNQGEINTYINLRMEDTSRNDVESVLKDCQLDLSLIEELQFILTDTPEEELSSGESLLHNDTIRELEKLISSKLDLAFLQVMCEATSLANSETGNLQQVLSNDQVFMCVWGNLMKNPRIRNFEYPEVRFSFDIPRVLALSDCSVTLLITKFDHFSRGSRSAIPRHKKKEEEVPEQAPETTEEQQVSEENQEIQDKEENEDQEEEKEEKEETELDLMAALRGAENEEEEQKEEEEEEEVFEEDFAFPPTPEPTEWEDFDEADDIVDLRANDVLGGVFTLRLLQTPPQPKTAGSWNITKVVDPPELNAIDYVAEAPVPPVEGVKESKDNKDKKDEKPPIQISMVLPKDVMFLEEPQVARWDEKKNMWSTDGFLDINFNEEARTLAFKTLSFGTMCLLQDSHINMPFQSWEIRPHKLNSALITIIAAIVEIEIEIKDALCCLSQPQDKPELESIRNKWVTPAELIRMLKKAGVNVFPNEDSSKYVNIQNKHPLIEETMYQQMALTASAMAFSLSKWNGETEREQIVFQGAEALEDEPLLEEDWSVFLATKHRVTKLKMTEFDETFADEAVSDTERYSTLKSGSVIKRKTGPAEEADATRSQSSSFKLPDVTNQHGSSASRSSLKAGKFGRISTKLRNDAKKHLASLQEFEQSGTPLEKFFKSIDMEKSLFKSNIYHLMSDIASETAQQRVKDTNYQFVDCVHQLLKATKVLTYA